MGNVASSRIEWVDIVKGFAMAAVVAIHTTYKFPQTNLFNITAYLGGSWHVPVFFMLSGFFLKEEKLKSPLIFLRPKIKTLYIPYITYFLIALLLHNFFYNNGMYTSQVDTTKDAAFEYGHTDYIKYGIMTLFLVGREPICGAMWFLSTLIFALIGLSLIHFIVYIFVKDRLKARFTVASILLSLSVFSCLLTQSYGIEIPRISKVMTAMWLIYCGFLIRNCFNCKFNNKYILIIAAIVAWHCLTPAGGGINLSNNQYFSVITLTITAAASLYILCWIAQKIQGGYIGEMFKKIGKDSLHVMALHFITFKLLTLVLLFLGLELSLAELVSPCKGSIILWLLFTITGCLFPLLVIAIFRKLKTIISYKFKQKTTLFFKG